MAGPWGRAFGSPKGMLGPAIHDFAANQHRQSWMAGPSPAMTKWE